MNLGSAKSGNFQRFSQEHVVKSLESEPKEPMEGLGSLYRPHKLSFAMNFYKCGRREGNDLH